MAAGTMFDITDEDVVCQTDCEHTDCADSRKLATTPCNMCDKIIKAGERFFLDDNREPQHAVCVWKAEEKRQAERKEAP